MNNFIWPIDRILTDTSTSCQSRPGSNGLEKGTPPSPVLQDWNVTINLFKVISRTLVAGFVPYCRSVISVFYSPSLVAVSIGSDGYSREGWKDLLAEKFVWMHHIYHRWHFCSMSSKTCNTDWRNVLTTKRTLLTNETN